MQISMAEQKVSLQVGKSTEQQQMLGEQLLSDDLVELGLDEHEPHFKITFNNEQTAKYSVCMLNI